MGPQTALQGYPKIHVLVCLALPPKNRKIENASAVRSALNRPCALIRIRAGADLPSVSAMVSWPTHASGGFNCWEGQPRHRTRDSTPTHLRLGESLWELRSRPLVSSHPATSSQGAQRLSTRVSHNGQLLLRRRKNPRSLLSSCMSTPVWATASSSAPWTYSRATWVWYTLCRPSLHSSLSSSRVEAQITGSSVGLSLHGVPRRADCIATPGGRCEKRQGLRPLCHGAFD